MKMEMEMNIYFEAKDTTRIADILEKAANRTVGINARHRKEIQLAQAMAKSITKDDKALRRARAAEDLKQFDLAAIFHDRYTELCGLTAVRARREIVSVCAYCSDKDEKVAAAHAAGKIVSHGICASCYRIEIAKLDEMVIDPALEGALVR